MGRDQYTYYREVWLEGFRSRKHYSKVMSIIDERVP